MHKLVKNDFNQGNICSREKSYQEERAIKHWSKWPREVIQEPQTDKEHQYQLHKLGNEDQQSARTTPELMTAQQSFCSSISRVMNSTYSRFPEKRTFGNFPSMLALAILAGTLPSIPWSDQYSFLQPWKNTSISQNRQA